AEIDRALAAAHRVGGAVDVLGLHLVDRAVLRSAVSGTSARRRASTRNDRRRNNQREPEQRLQVPDTLSRRASTRMPCVRSEPTAAILLIGNEILSGKVEDQNAKFLIRELRALGVTLRRVEIVPDT